MAMLSRKPKSRSTTARWGICHQKSAPRKAVIQIRQIMQIMQINQITQGNEIKQIMGACTIMKWFIIPWTSLRLTIPPWITP